MAPWYHSRWWYIERPFPWLAVVACVVPIVIAVSAVALGIWWFS